MSKVVSADPDFVEFSLLIEDLLSTVIIPTPEGKHLNIIEINLSVSTVFESTIKAYLVIY